MLGQTYHQRQILNRIFIYASHTKILIKVNLLYMNNELSKTANENTRVSWFESSSRAPMPSVSITIMFRGVPSACWPIIGDPQIQRPFVQGFTVGPTPNPFCRSKIMRFIRYDFPVLYIPTTDITPIGAFIAFTISIASLLTVYSK